MKDPDPLAVWRHRNRRKCLRRLIAAIVFSIALALNLWIALALANDEPNDGKLYEQVATNLVNFGVFSEDADMPKNPTLIRLPGYPLFLAGVYETAGVGNNTAVRACQAIIYTCASLLAAIVAMSWVSGSRRRRRRGAAWVFILAALCPFTTIFAATILTETLTMFFLAVLMLAATFAIRSSSTSESVIWWVIAGIASGAAVLLRPDSGLFALGTGLTIIASVFAFADKLSSFRTRIFRCIWQGSVLSAAFVVVLIPWTIRNEEIFGIFQPLAPAHAEMPGEFVPTGYFLWLRTWIDDSRYIGPMLWDLEDKPINIEQIPSSAFDSDRERDVVAGLLDQYNHSDPDQAAGANTDADAKDENPDADATGDETDEPDDGANSDDGRDQNADPDADKAAGDDSLDLKISPDVDAGFRAIALQRIDHDPVRFYIQLPSIRAASMWFDTHSAYYPFGGEIFPLKDLDSETYQNIWLPMFGGLTWIYTLLAFGGAIVLWRRGPKLWLVMALLLSVPRIVFFGTLENPEPRYLVELFLIAAVLGGVVLGQFELRRTKKGIALELNFRAK